MIGFKINLIILHCLTLQATCARTICVTGQFLDQTETLEHRWGICAGYAKYETFPIWNIPLKHPVNLAYKAATADLNDVNMIDPFHLDAYGETTVNYNRDVEIHPVLNVKRPKDP